MKKLSVNLPGKDPDVFFVHLPFSHLMTPPGAAGLLKAELTAAGIGCAVHYSELAFLKAIGRSDYDRISLNIKQRYMVSERLFAEGMGLPVTGSIDEYEAVVQRLAAGCGEEDLAAALLDAMSRCRPIATDFIQQEAAYIASHKPKIVACPSVFNQMCSVIAFCRAIKELDSSIVTLVGGPNCMGRAGIAVANLVPWIDYTFSGEADECIADLCRLLMEKGTSARQEELPYGAIKKDGCRLTDEAPCRLTKNLDSMAIPDYTDYYREVREYGLEEVIRPVIPIEFSRGCWWGQKHPCSFCGLNGQANVYREKSPQRVMREVIHQRSLYGVDKFYLSDNILSRNHMKDLIPQMADLGCSFFCEIKTNTSRAELETLSRSGFKWFQAGIESLNDGCLQLMNKGNKAIRHVELLKNARITGVMMLWNMLSGFPSEKAQWYGEMAELVKKITHYEHPASSLSRLVIQRFNAYWRNPGKYGLELQTAEIYKYAYPAVPGFIENTAYNYEPTSAASRRLYYNPALIAPEYQALEKNLIHWLISSSRSAEIFTMDDNGETIELFDLRSIAKDSLTTLRDCRAAVYRAADSVISLNRLHKALRDSYDSSEIDEAVDDLVRKNFLLRIEDELLALALPSDCPPLRTDAWFL